MNKINRAKDLQIIAWYIINAMYNPVVRFSQRCLITKSFFLVYLNCILKLFVLNKYLYSYQQLFFLVETFCCVLHFPCSLITFSCRNLGVGNKKIMLGSLREKKDAHTHLFLKWTFDYCSKCRSSLLLEWIRVGNI